MKDIKDMTKEEKLLRAIGEIEDAYIENAELDEPEVKEVNIKAGKKQRRTRWISGIAAVLVCCFCIQTVLGGNLFGFMKMGASAPTEDAGYGYMSESSDGGYGFGSEESYDKNGQFESVPDDLAADADVPGVSDSVNRDVNASEAKRIYRADLYLQTKEYDESFESLKTLVADMGGYFESTQTFNGGYYNDSYMKDGFFCVRIPVDNYDKFMEAVNENFYVAGLEEHVDDVTLYYSDVEGRLETYRIKEERLQELLKQASDMSDIIEIESALSENEFMIEQFESALRGYDNQISYATMNINLEEVPKTEGGLRESATFGSRFIRALKNGGQDFYYSILEFILFITYNITEIIALVIVVVLMRKFHVIRRIRDFIRLRSKL